MAAHPITPMPGGTGPCGRKVRPHGDVLELARRLRAAWIDDHDAPAVYPELVQDGGLTLYPDWSSPTMLQTMGQSFQEMLVGRASPQDVIKRMQDDWEEYHQELAGS